MEARQKVDYVRLSYPRPTQRGIGIARVRVMLTIGLTEAKRRFEELVERAKRGERIRITKYGKLKAEIAAPRANREGASATGKARKHSGRAPSRRSPK